MKRYSDEQVVVAVGLLALRLRRTPKAVDWEGPLYLRDRAVAMLQFEATKAEMQRRAGEARQMTEIARMN